ncbi:MAG: hypothetical protein WCF36_00165 [Candidatus Nanopelagicales bacterium]
MTSLAVPADEGFGHMWNSGWASGWGGGWGGAWMMLMWVAILALTIWAIVALTRSGTDRTPGRSTPRQVLDQRFAAGEIDQTEYRTARNLLTRPDTDLH